MNPGAQAVPIELEPPPSYPSFGGAIAAARNDPLQPKASADTKKLLGSFVADVSWTDATCAIRFSNDLWLHIRSTGTAIEWAVSDEVPQLDATPAEQIGSPAMLIRFPNGTEHVWDRSALATARLGCEFKRLYVTSGALLIYCRDQLIWWFSAGHRTDTGQPLLFTTEGD